MHPLNSRNGRLTIKGYIKHEKLLFYICECDCGNVKEINRCNFERTNSCGCFRKERMKGYNPKKTHGMTNKTEYQIWRDLKQRCKNPNDNQYKYYGARGIYVSEEWEKFENFYRDMGDRPSNKYSIERIDNNGPYCKENCKWATSKEQNNNKSSNLPPVTINGETKKISEWLEIYKVGYATFLNRRNRLKWTTEKAITTPVKKQNKKDN